MFLVDHSWSMAGEAGCWFALGPVQQGFLNGQGDLSRKRLDKYLPKDGQELRKDSQCRTKNREVNPRDKQQQGSGNPGTQENAQEESTGFHHLTG